LVLATTHLKDYRPAGKCVGACSHKLESNISQLEDDLVLVTTNWTVISPTVNCCGACYHNLGINIAQLKIAVVLVASNWRVKPSNWNLLWCLPP